MISELKQEFGFLATNNYWSNWRKLAEHFFMLAGETTTLGKRVVEELVKDAYEVVQEEAPEILKLISESAVTRFLKKV